MTWLGLLLIGIATSDLVFSWLRRPRVAEAVAAVLVLVLGLGAGTSGVGAVISLLTVALGVVAWGESVTHAFGGATGSRPARGTGRFVLPLVVLGVELFGALLGSLAPPPGGAIIATVLSGSSWPLLVGLETPRALLLVGVLLVQLSTGNVVVRLVLGASGTTNPLRSTTGSDPALKGGRLLGPMERLLIVGLGLAGEVTAASIVIAAKGLLRFPELQAARPGQSPAKDADKSAENTAGPGIHEVTEYFLVGSFVSWTVSLVALALVAAP